ncbi:MAG: hypothetical protein HY360_25000 [Verrucomicrobia bacterium]|nr:hypothetical protein [Verrucomicrobiota bacterium]
MKTFTVRDLDRKPALVLDACDKDGAVRIRRRNGHSYMLQPEEDPTRKVAWRQFLIEHRARVTAIFPERLTQAQTQAVDQLITGE